MKRRLLVWRLVLAATAVTWLAARALGWSVPQALAGSLLAGLLPGLALLRGAGLLGRSWVWTLFGAGALSPPLLGAVNLLLARGHWPVDLVGGQVLMLSAIVLVWPTRENRHEPPFVPECARQAPADRAALIAGACAALLVACGQLNPFVRQWSDGWFHAAVFHDVARAGVPPDFPHFAGERLPYPWLVHVALASIRHVVSRDPFVLLALLNVWAAFLLPLGVYVLARSLGATAAAARWSAGAAVLGVNPFGIVWATLASFIGESRGWSVLGQALANTNSVQVALSFGFPFFQSSTWARWWTPTAFNFALVLVALALALLFEVWRRPRPRNTALLGVVLCLLLLWHTLTALALGAALLVGAVVALADLARRDRVAALIQTGLLGGVALAALLLARPYLRSITLRTEGLELMRWAFSRPNAAGLVFSMGVVALAGVIGWRRWSPDTRTLATAIAISLVIPYLFFDLPGPAEEKLYYPLFVLMAAASGIGLAGAWRRGSITRAAVAVAVLCALLSAMATARAFLGDRRAPRELFTADRAPGVFLYTPDEAAALRWIRERSPGAAVFLQSPRPFSNEPILVHGERRLFCGPAEFFYRATFFPSPGMPPAPAPVWAELKRREALQAAVFSERALAPDTLALLRGYPWPLYVWQDTSLAHGRLSPTLAAPDTLARAAFVTPSVRVLELSPTLHRR